MAIHFGNDNIKDIYVGSNKIKEVYYGSEKVWGTQPAVQDGYWVHKDTDAVTYFGADADFITGGIMGYPSWMPNCSEVKLPSGVTGFKTYNWVIEDWDNYEVTYTGFVHTKETYLEGNEVLIDVDLSNTSITSISEYAFSSCYALASINIPESVTSLEEGCFSQCYSLTSINIPEGVTSIGEYCFASCYSLPSITLPESITSIKRDCFTDCSSLTSIDIPEGVTSLGESCFTNCESLSSITLPESVTILGMGCFSWCPSLTSITLPESVTSLEGWCFEGCSALTLATVLPAIPPILGDGVFDLVHASFNIKVHSPYVNAYKTATNWSAYADKISAIEEEPPITDGYWKHYQTEVITPIYLTDSNIEDENTWRRPSWFDVASEIKLPTGILYIEFDGTSPGLANMLQATLLDLPSTIIHYSTGFLGNTTKLQTVIVRNPTPATSANVSFGANIGDMGNFDGLYVPAASLNAYKTTAPWSAFASFIKSL